MVNGNGGNFSIGGSELSVSCRYHEASIGSNVTVAPIFSSLIEAGQVGVDVLIARPRIPLFLQFKLAHRMTRRRAWEAQRAFAQTDP